MDGLGASGIASRPSDPGIILDHLWTSALEFTAERTGELRVDCAAYSVGVSAEGPSLEIRWSQGRLVLGAGAGEKPSRWSLGSQLGDVVRVTLTAEDGRRVTLECREDCIYAWAEIPDPGDAPVVLCGPRPPLFDQLFSPEPTAERQYLFGPGDRALTSVWSDPDYHQGNWFFSPPPLCFGIQSGAGALAIGVGCPSADLDFSAFEYDGGFRFRYQGAPQTPYRSPRLLLLPTAGDGQMAVEACCQYLRRLGLAPSGTGRARPSWWAEPGFCGWGEQSYQGCESPTFVPGHLPEGTAARCTQRLYEDSIALLEAEGIHPGVVTVDDKWQRVYGMARPDGQRWPDLRGFIAEQHRRGRRVLLWWKLWDGEGLPGEDLLPGVEGLVVDPTSPSYRQLLAREVRHALLELGADGFKVDFLHRGPTRQHGPARAGLSGVRLLRSMLEAIRNPALEAKEDMLLVAHAANPFLADLVDMVRLNDISCPPGVAEIGPEMRLRARIARAACPDALIDTDNWPCPSRQLWREYVVEQPEIGVPSLYYASGIDMSGEHLLPEDYALVRETWSRWRRGEARDLSRMPRP